MKRIVFLLVLVAGCKTVTVVAPAGNTGAPAPKAAVERFVLAAKMQDVQALGAVFGDEKGPMRDHTPRPQMEQRAVIMLACLRHDSSKIAEVQSSINGRQTVMVDFVQGKLTGQSLFTVAKGPENRWYVVSFDIVAMQNKGFCSKA